MPEELLDLRGVPKPEAYRQVDQQIRAVLDHVDDDIAAMATVSAILHHAFGFLWTGFYRVTSPDSLLRVGPYQGTLGCLEITFGRGVCGRAAAEMRTITVDDVGAFPGHIACDARSRSEIVVPVTNRNGRLIAVLDIDSAHLNAFDKNDERGLERIVEWFARHSVG